MEVDVLITGHTHWAFINKIDKILLLNPGSPTVPRTSDPTVMVLKIEDNIIDSKIVKIGESSCKMFNYKGKNIK